MGVRLVQIYSAVEEKGGMEARIRLSERSGIPKNQAATMEDRPDIVTRVKRLATEILGQNIDELLR